MYSPKIREDLIPILYRLAKEKETTMTKIVDEFLRPALIEHEARRSIPYCMSCYSVVEVNCDKPKATAYCSSCKAETVLLYTLPKQSDAV
jgi:hypothetical protein